MYVPEHGPADAPFHGANPRDSGRCVVFLVRDSKDDLRQYILDDSIPCSLDRRHNPSAAQDATCQVRRSSTPDTTVFGENVKCQEKLEPCTITSRWEVQPPKCYMVSE